MRKRSEIFTSFLPVFSEIGSDLGRVWDGVRNAPFKSERYFLVRVKSIMLNKVMSNRHGEKFSTYIGEKMDKNLGKCLICGERVKNSQRYLTVSEGYTHKGCLKEWRSE